MICHISSPHFKKQYTTVQILHFWGLWHPLVVMSSCLQSSFFLPLGDLELKTPYMNKAIKKYSLQYLKEKLQYLKEPTKISPFYDTYHRMGKHLINILNT